MFQITEMTEAHVASVTNRTETHGDEKVPAVSIGLELIAQPNPTAQPLGFGCSVELGGPLK